MTDVLGRMIQEAVDRYVEEAVREAVEVATQSVRDKLPNIAATVSLAVHRHLSISRNGPDLIIRVQIEEPRT